MLSTKEKIKHWKLQATAMLSIPKVDESYVENYWRIKEELFEEISMWERCYGQKPPTMQEDLIELSYPLNSVWHRICQAGMN